VKNSEGGMRNAVSLFEQLIVDSKISYDHIVETLGVASEDEKQSFISKLLQ
jgi:DNA polymerase III gamma/tau subunit